jgi:hypothetical protein
MVVTTTDGALVAPNPSQPEKVFISELTTCAATLIAMVKSSAVATALYSAL